MNRKIMVIVLLMSIVFWMQSGFLGLNKSKTAQKPNNKVILATINKEVITADDLNERIKAYPQQYDVIMKNPEYKEKILDQLIDESALYTYAKDQGTEKTEAFQKQLSIAKKQMAIAMVLKDATQKVSVTETELREYYAANISQFNSVEERKLSHILVSDENDAEAILKEIKAGASFADIAKKKSVDPSGERGGELGWFVKNGQLVSEFENAAFSLKNKGDISNVVKTQFGYHIIRLDDVGMRKKVDFIQAKPKIEEYLRVKKAEQLVKKLLEDIKKKYKITKDASKLK